MLSQPAAAEYGYRPLAAIRFAYDRRSCGIEGLELLVIARFLLALVVTFLLAATFASIHVQGQLVDMGATLEIGQRLQHILHDWVSMASGLLFPAAIGIGLLVAFLLAGLAARWLPTYRVIGFALAGALGVLGAHWLAHQPFDTHVLAAAGRTGIGLALQGLAGFVGGYVFARMFKGERSA